MTSRWVADADRRAGRGRGGAGGARPAAVPARTTRLGPRCCLLSGKTVSPKLFYQNCFTKTVLPKLFCQNCILIKLFWLSTATRGLNSARGSGRAPLRGSCAGDVPGRRHRPHRARQPAAGPAERPEPLGAKRHPGRYLLTLFCAPCVHDFMVFHEKASRMN